MTPQWVLDLSSRGWKGRRISALHCAGWLFVGVCVVCVCVVCVCVVCVCVCVCIRTNEDICFHPGNVGSSWFLPVQETISSHLLSTDCSGRSKHVLSAICPGQGVYTGHSLRPSRQKREMFTCCFSFGVIKKPRTDAQHEKIVKVIVTTIIKKIILQQECIKGLI